MSPADGARARSFVGPEVVDPAEFEPDEVPDGATPNRATPNRATPDRANPDRAEAGRAQTSRVPTSRIAIRRATPQPGRGPGAPGPREDGATRWAEPVPAGRRSEPPADDRQLRDRPREQTALRSGIRLNGLWCAVLLVLGVAAALALTGALSWQPGIPMTVVLAAVGVAVALLAGRGGGFEAGILPGTVVVVVGAVVVGLDSGALGGAVAGLGPVSRVWQAIGLLAPAAAATWVCALVTLALRRAGLLRRF